jgi:hypothetical protein
VVRQQVLDLPFGGSNPSSRAEFLTNEKRRDEKGEGGSRLYPKIKIMNHES